MVTTSRDPSRPEGGWGWAVVIGCFMNQMLFEGIVRSYGFVYLALQERFHGSAVATSWIQACFSGIALALGPLASVLAERYSSRAVVVFGGALISLALIISSFTPNLYFLYFSYSFLGGVGGSLIYSPMFIIVSQYFDQKRGRALGLASLGAALGTFAIPTFVNFLLDHYGYQGCLLILGAMTLNHCVSGCLYRPIKHIEKRTDEQSEEVITGLLDADDVTMTKDLDMACSMGNLHRPLSPIPAYLQTNTYHSDGALDKGNKTSVLYSQRKEYLFPQSTTVISDIRYRSKPSLAESIGMLFESALSLTFDLPKNEKCFNESFSHTSTDLPLNSESGSRVKVVVNGDTIATTNFSDEDSKHPDKETKLSIFHNISYLLFCFEIFTLSSTVLPNFVFLPPLAKEKGLSDQHISVLLAVVGATGFIGTFVIGIVFDLKAVRQHKRLFYAGLSVFHGTATMCMAFAPGFATMVIAACCIGFVITSLIGQRANACSHYVTAEQLPFAFGIITMFQGFGNLIGPGIQGILKDRYDTYKPCFIFGGLFLLMSSSFVIIDYFVRHLVATRRTKSDIITVTS